MGYPRGITPEAVRETEEAQFNALAEMQRNEVNIPGLRALRTIDDAEIERVAQERAKAALTDPEARRKAAKALVADAMRGEVHEHRNPHKAKMFRGDGLNMWLPVTSGHALRRCIIFFLDQGPGLLAEMDRLRDDDSKCLLAYSKLRSWSDAFRRWGKVA